MIAPNIAALAADYHAKKVRRDALAARNVYGLSLDEEREASIAFHQADYDAVDAYLALESAKWARG